VEARAMAKSGLRWLLDAFGQNVLGWAMFGGGLVAIYTVLHAIWNKLAWYELVSAGCTFASGWILFAILWLQRRRAKLVIHEAKWGIGDVRYRDVTIMLRGHLKDNAINVPVMNETFKGDPYEGVKKHLIVRYSYGSSVNKEIIRHETDQLILPEHEDRASSIFANTRFAKDSGATSNLIPEEQQKKAESVPQRDWSGNWKELSRLFEPLTRSGIRADHQKAQDYERWDITGGDRAAADRIVTLCKHAGELLSKSPNVSRAVPAEILAMADSGDRWLSYLKHSKPISFRFMGYGIERLDETLEKQISPFHILLGSINDLALVSANECLECAGKEY
jgi:hypothetical protein